MIRYQRLFEFYNATSTLKSGLDSKISPYIEKINNAVELVRDRYESLDYMRTVKGRTVSLSTYLPDIQIEIPEEFQSFSEYSEDENESPILFSGFFVPSIERLKEIIDNVRKSETAVLKLPIIFESFKTTSDGKVIDERRREKFKDDSFYVGKIADGEPSEEEIKSWFREK